MCCFELLALPLWYGRTVCSFCGNYLFKKLESWGWCVVSDTQERELLFFFYSDPAPRALLYFPCFPSFPSCGFFDGNITSKIKHKGFSFHSPTQHVIANVCLNLWTFLHNFLTSPTPLPHPAQALLNSPLSISSLFGYCTQGEFKVTLKYHTSWEVHHTCIWSQSL